MSFQISELERRLAGLIRFGTVEAADYARARVRVRMGEAVTDWLPWLTLRAGKDRSWWPLEPGEQVLVLSVSGDTSQGVVLGSIFQQAHPAPAASKDLDRREYSDGAVIEYDRAAHRLRANIPGDAELVASGDISANAGKNITGIAGTKVELTAPSITLNGVIFLNGPLTQGGGSGGGNAEFRGSLRTTGEIHSEDDVTSRVSLNGHTHPCPHGGNTGAPS
ncbi:phage baseplate assembly protein V [Desulfobaculum bizertense]|uniref:phage baseplate assembly protein V n=1 Tax=Desulfobaculum bizertense TaxID=376490 RepID=UPI001F34898B|nr:phage baseplate assembly protein V [Desulfobaculum bizertense]UIJ38965.1 phage baseplate assembly protein V [Desulfobaculum bizertense]